jgi:hypothetical protein
MAASPQGPDGQQPRQAAAAIGDLASIKFGIEEIAASTHDGTRAAELLGRES